MNLKQFDEHTEHVTHRPIYEKRYKKNGEEYLKKVDEIDIVEDLKEKQLEIERIWEIINQQERLKAEQLIDAMTNEEFLDEIKQLEITDGLDTYEFLNKTEELKSLYNKMPENIRQKYNNLSKFSKEYLPEFIKETEQKVNIKKELEKQQANIKTQEEINNEIQNQIEQLQNQLKENNENV